MSRNRGFDRDDFTSSESQKMPSWLEDFANNLEKNATTAVEQARLRQADLDYYSQISSIVGGNKKHATVASIVEEYQELTGLKKYLKTLSEQEHKDNIKISQAQAKQEALFSVKEDDDLLPKDINHSLKSKIKTFIKNKIESYNGHVSIPAIQDDLLKTLKNEGIEPYHVYDPSLAKYIGNILSDYLKNNQLYIEDDSHLGMAITDIEDDGSNKDFLHSLQNKNK